MRDINNHYALNVSSGAGTQPRLADLLKVNCTRPWDHVELWPNTSALRDARIALGSPGAREARDFADYAASHGLGEIATPSWETIMATFTFNNPQTCVFQDDLDALNVLYPTCTGAVLTPQCDSPRTYLGLVRLAAYVGMPIVFLLVLMIAVHALRCVLSYYHLLPSISVPYVSFTSPPSLYTICPSRALDMLMKTGSSLVYPRVFPPCLVQSEDPRAISRETQA